MLGDFEKKLRSVGRAGADCDGGGGVLRLGVGGVARGTVAGLAVRRGRPVAWRATVLTDRVFRWSPIRPGLLAPSPAPRAAAGRCRQGRYTG